MVLFRKKISPETLGTVIFSHIGSYSKLFVDEESFYEELDIKKDNRNHIFIEIFIIYIFAALQVIESNIREEYIWSRIENSIFGHLSAMITQTYNLNDDELKEFKDFANQRISEYVDTYNESLSHNIPLMKLGRIMISNIAEEDVVDAIKSTMLISLYTNFMKSLADLIKQYKIIL